MWTTDDWSQRHIDKERLAAKLESIGITVLGWCNRKPELIREDGNSIDWGEVEGVAGKLFAKRLTTPQPEPKIIPPKDEQKKPVKKPKSRSRKKAPKKK